MTFEGKNQREDEEQLFHVLITKAQVDPTSEQVYCPFCHCLMKYLPGFPQGHAQWLCEGCGNMAYQGYGDTPSRDTDYKMLSSPNNPYPTDDMSKSFIHDLPSDLDEEQDRTQYGRVDINSVDKRRRYGMQFAFLTAEQATRQI